MIFWSTINQKSKYCYLKSVKNQTNIIEKEVMDELANYFSSLLTFDMNNPIVWWQIYQQIYSNIYRLAMKILSISATSAESERLFSVGKLIVGDHKHSTDPSSICNQMFLYSNIDLFLKINLKEFLLNSTQ
jgi:hypothetical protein